jgi:glucose-6-phosphate 1-dehydrogenase
MSDLPATVFVLYGATGDLAKRMVLPAFFDLYARGLLPRRWKLIGNGRGDVAHENFRGHVHDVLTEFGTAPTDEQWAGFAPDLLFAGGGFRAEDGGTRPGRSGAGPIIRTDDHEHEVPPLCRRGALLQRQDQQ